LVVCSTLVVPADCDHHLSRQPSPIVTSAIDIATILQTPLPNRRLSLLAHTDLLATNTFIDYYLIDYPIIPNTAGTSPRAL
jgi:hypothetical protein